MAKRRQKGGELVPTNRSGYDGLLAGVSTLLDGARHSAARAVNVVLTATYWEVGRRMVEFEQAGKGRAEYGDGLLKRLGDDLSRQLGRGFGWRNLTSMRAFYLGWSLPARALPGHVPPPLVPLRAAPVRRERGRPPLQRTCSAGIVSQPPDDPYESSVRAPPK